MNNGIDTVKLATKEDEKEILENQRTNGVITYSSSIAGIISYKFDGNEEKYSYKNLENITKLDIENENNDYNTIDSDSNSIKDGNVILRVINNYELYVVTYINEEESKYFKESQSVILRSDDDEIEEEVYKIKKENENYMAIFKINNQNIGIYDTRVKEFDIIYKQIEGLKIPKSAVKKVDNKDGVYVINEERKETNFVELKGILYEDDNYIYIDYYQNKVNGINTVDLYDKIILKPNIMNIKMKIE